MSPTGAGAHLVEKVNVKGRKNLKNYNKSKTPRYYPYGTPENAGQAHLRLHEATKKEGIRLQGGNPNLSDKELIKKYKIAYADPELEGILGDLRTPNSKTIIATNATPKQAMEELQKWEINERKQQKNKSGTTNKSKSK